jgi:hypothetical protein
VDIVVYRTYPDKLGLMAANNTTPYVVSFVNLAQTGPLMFDLPRGPNASVLHDMWQRPIADFGQTGPGKMPVHLLSPLWAGRSVFRPKLELPDIAMVK